MLRCVKQWIPALFAVVVLGLAVMLDGCSPAALMEKVPTDMGGLPADAPAPSATSYQYPAVHDMPPPRSDKPLTDEQQDKLEKDLQAARDKLQSQQKADQAAAEKKPAPAGKKPADKKAAANSKKKTDTVKKPEDAGAASKP
jgi:Spy/CpxP family protein refolding chaperone